MTNLKAILKKIRFSSVFILSFLVASFSQGQTSNDEEKVFQILRNNSSQILNTEQLLLVFNENPESNRATLYFLQKRKTNWKIIQGPVNAFIGRNGFAAKDQKREGDGKSPTGFFKLGQSFGYDSKSITKLPYIQVNSEDKWIDDPESPDYNKYVRGSTQAKSFEKLLLDYNAYKYCTVIEYNTNPIIKGNGSAIFFHLSDKPTAGCVAIGEKEMKKILKKLDAKKNPSILMGNKRDLEGT